MGVREKIEWRTTMVVDGIEHILLAYDDDNGHGTALCGQAVGPWAIGPRFDEAVTCVECKEVLRRRLEHDSAKR